MPIGSTTLGQIIDGFRRGEDVVAANYVYADYDLGDIRNPDTSVFLDQEPNYDAEGEPIMPEAVEALGLWTFCSAELLSTVVEHALKRHPEASNAQIVCALDHYMQEDDFLDL